MNIFVLSKLCPKRYIPVLSNNANLQLLRLNLRRRPTILSGQERRLISCPSKVYPYKKKPQKCGMFYGNDSTVNPSFPNRSAKGFDMLQIFYVPDVLDCVTVAVLNRISFTLYVFMMSLKTSNPLILWYIKRARNSMKSNFPVFRTVSVFVANFRTARYQVVWQEKQYHDCPMPVEISPHGGGEKQQKNRSPDK